MQRNRTFILLILIGLFFTTSASAEEKFFEIKAKKFSYTPNIIKVNKGDTVRIRLLSEDVSHGLYLDGYEVNTSSQPGQDGNLKFIADKTGRFTFRCSVACGEFHPYMVGHLIVEPNWKYYFGIFPIVIFGLGSLVLTLRRKNDSKDKLFGIIPLSWRFELTKYKPIRALFKSRWFPFILIVANLAIFTVIILANFVGGFSAGSYNFGIMIVWILWWVLLMLFMVPVVGRLWCMICPFPLIGDWLQRGKLIGVGRQKSWGLNKRWPSKWRNLWPLVILFWVATWFSGFFTVRPFASFILLGGIILGAIVLALIYGKRNFCLFVCPVSGFQGLYSNFALCEVRVKDPEVCENHKVKTCFVGNEDGYGCPWMELPYDMNRNTYCGLCLECFKTCPHDNMAFNLRPLGADFMSERKRTDDMYRRRSTDEAFKALTMMGIFFSFFIAFQGPFAYFKDTVRGVSLGKYISYLAEASVIDFLLIPASLLLFAFLSKIASRNKEVKLKDVFVNFSYCLVPIGLTIWAAFSLGIILPNGSYLLRVLSDPFGWGWNLFGTAHSPWTPIFTGVMPYLQMGSIFVGLLFALDFGFKFSLQTYSTLEEAKRGWIPILCYLVLITIACLWLFLSSMAVPGVIA